MSDQPAIVLDQSKIRIITTKPIKPGAEFPRSITWWRRNVPLWLDVSIDDNGHVVLEPNGKRADGAVLDVTPALRRRHLGYARDWVARQIHFDFINAIVNRPTT